MIRISHTLGLLLFPSFATNSEGMLEKYIERGLDSNLALKQKTFDLKRAQLDLDRAKTLFYPQANFNAQYTLATGGRITQDILSGDLLKKCICNVG